MKSKPRYRKPPRRKRKPTRLYWLTIQAIIVALFCFTWEPGRLPAFDMKKFLIINLVLIVILFMIKLFWKDMRRLRYLKSPVGKIDKMTGEEFEKYLRARYESQGYKVSLTPLTNDFGADLVLTGHGNKIVVQAKRYKDKVGEAAVQQVIAAREYYGADKAKVVTNSSYTQAAKELAKGCGVELISRKELFSGKI